MVPVPPLTLPTCNLMIWMPQLKSESKAHSLFCGLWCPFSVATQLLIHPRASGKELHKLSARQYFSIQPKSPPFFDISNFVILDLLFLGSHVNEKNSEELQCNFGSHVYCIGTYRMCYMLLCFASLLENDTECCINQGAYSRFTSHLETVLKCPSSYLLDTQSAMNLVLALTTSFRYLNIHNPSSNTCAVDFLRI